MDWILSRGISRVKRTSIKSAPAALASLAANVLVLMDCSRCCDKPARNEERSSPVELEIKNERRETGLPRGAQTGSNGREDVVVIIIVSRDFCFRGIKRSPVDKFFLWGTR